MARNTWAVVLALAGWLAGPGIAAAEDREAWDAIYIGAQKVGHTHIKVGPVKDAKGREFYRVQVNTVLSFKRGNDRVNMEVRYGTIETPEGEVLRLDTRTRAGREELRTYGDVVNGTMNLILEGGGQKRSVPVAWPADVRGPYAAELSLSREPIQPGQARDVKTFVPDLNQVCTTHLKAGALEDVTLGGGTVRQLLRVDSTVSDPKGQPMPELDTTLWVDSGGQILKSHAALLGGMDSYRTTQAAAMGENGSFDLLSATTIKIARGIAESEKTRNIVYRVRLEEADPAQVFPADQRQTVRPASADGWSVLEVRSDSPSTPATAASSSDEDLRPNPLINSDDPQVVSHMRKATAGKDDPWSRAVAIQDWVFNNLKKKNFKNAFANAREVARNLEGDCTEHSVLTAAMCRAAGLPTRVVVGLVYAAPLGGFGPHAWNEVFVNGRWVAIDATFHQSEVDATHLKLATSSLDGVAPFETFLPVVRVFNKLKLEPVEVR